MFRFPKNRNTIIILSSLATAYIALVVMMVIYEKNVSDILSQRYENVVRRSMLQTARKMEEKELLGIISQIANDSTPESHYARRVLNTADDESISGLLLGYGSLVPNDSIDSSPLSRSLQSDENLKAARLLMLEVISRKYNYYSSLPIYERIDPRLLRSLMTAELKANGIPDSFSYAVVCEAEGVCEYFHQKPFNVNDKDENVYRQSIFRREVNDHPIYLVVRMEGRSAYTYRYVWQVLPIIICMSILLVLLILLVYHTSRRETLTDIQKAFVKNMTHELKTPVASISLASEMLSDPSLHFSTETYAAKCRIINNEAKRLSAIIERVLQTSVLEQKHFSYSTDTVNVNDVVTSAHDSFILKVQKQSPGSRIFLHLNASSPVIYADRVHITNVVYNIMDNALKYRDTSRPLILEIVTRNEGNRIFIDFTDNGIGISNENLSHVFDKFFRVNTGDRHDVKGFGLGLSYVKHVVTHNGGNISVQSKPGVGSRFTFDFQAFDS